MYYEYIVVDPIFTIPFEELSDTNKEYIRGAYGKNLNQEEWKDYNDTVLEDFYKSFEFFLNENPISQLLLKSGLLEDYNEFWNRFQQGNELLYPPIAGVYH